jgi:uncharacterized protein (TIGR02466 family)
MAAIIQPLFSIPLYVRVRDAPISDTEMRAVQNLEYVSNVGNDTSISNYVLSDVPAFKDIRAFCLNCLSEYMLDVMSSSDRVGITISWMNRTKAGQKHHQHFHPNSIYSGSFYFQDTESAPIIFSNPIRERSNFEFNNVKAPNQYNAANLAVPCKAASCVIFPSWLRHEVAAPPAGARPRFSIAFNTFLTTEQPYGSDKFRTTIPWR